MGLQSLVLDGAAFQRLCALGYAYGGDHGRPQHVFRKGAHVPWEFLVHVVEYDGEMWRNFIRFRDHLRSHPEDAHAYAALKEGLLARRESWYSGRDEETFIAPILSASA